MPNSNGESKFVTYKQLGTWGLSIIAICVTLCGLTYMGIRDTMRAKADVAQITSICEDISEIKAEQRNLINLANSARLELVQIRTHLKIKPPNKDD